MKGIVFNLLERAVVEAHGEVVWEDALEDAGLDGAFTAVGTYPTEDFHALVTSIATKLGVSFDDATRWFGEVALPMLAERYPSFFEGHKSTVPFLLTLNDVIHPEVRKLFPGAYAPEFEFETPDVNGIELAYKSHRNLCGFAHGLVVASAERFGEQAHIEHVECTWRGDARCVLRCTFTST